MHRGTAFAWLGLPLLVGVAGCDDYLLPEVEVQTDAVDTILAISGDVGAGETAFEQHCQACHVKAGDQASAGPAIGPIVPTLDDREIVELVLGGQGIMPAIAVTDDEAADLLAWLRDAFGGAGADTDL